jgi:hypothetical protein
VWRSWTRKASATRQMNLQVQSTQRDGLDGTISRLPPWHGRATFAARGQVGGARSDYTPGSSSRGARLDSRCLVTKLLSW